MPAYAGLILAVIAVSWASIFIRWCGDTPALVIAFYRMFWSTLLLLIYQVIASPGLLRFRRLKRQSRGLIILAGILLALHFATWIASIQLTKISHSLILESTHPVFALLLSPLVLKEKGSWIAVVAAILTFFGIVIIAGQDVLSFDGKFVGDMLALASALFVTLYVLIARHQREQVQLIPYLIAVYAAATFMLFILVILFGHSFYHYPPEIHGIMLLLAIIPTGIGHSLINWAARKLPVYKVNFSILGEPIIASVLAFWFFGEQPYGMFYIGAIFILAGIILALFDRPGTM
ncbi:MAG: DMT family transporter [Calditrichaeota bacterium]|nr:DMT family transporter [Calditrichota bacterium]RQV98594.1 MAG: DMT family transporter [Calditrichota bacterium]